MFAILIIDMSGGQTLGHAVSDHGLTDGVRCCEGAGRGAPTAGDEP
jgi:hypothetical protein